MALPSDEKSIISTLDLQPHPEGGWFRETFRDAETELPNGRSASTMIYYFLQSGDFSHIHRLDAAEGWHFYAGNTIEIVELGESGAKVTRLGLDFVGGERPQYSVSKDTWFGCRLAEGSGREWALMGCTVAPGFEFAKFELGEREVLMELFPRCREWIEALTKKHSSSEE